MSDVGFLNFIRGYVSRQLENFFPATQATQLINIDAVERAISRTNYCVKRIKTTKITGFNYLNSGHYATFLYYLSHELWLLDKNHLEDATRVFLLNKALNGIDLYFEVEMPKVFLIGHTVGMVFAKANYGENCIFHQGCTIGRNEADRPNLGSGVILYPHASIIGKCNVRENTVVSPGVQIINQDTPGNCYVFIGDSGKLVFKEIHEYFSDRYFSPSE
jgi:serine O-acetyltransferase